MDEELIRAHLGATSDIETYVYLFEKELLLSLGGGRLIVFVVQLLGELGFDQPCLLLFLLFIFCLALVEHLDPLLELLLSVLDRPITELLISLGQRLLQGRLGLDNAFACCLNLGRQLPLGWIILVKFFLYHTLN